MMIRKDFHGQTPEPGEVHTQMLELNGSCQEDEAGALLAVEVEVGFMHVCASGRIRPDYR